MPFHLAEPRTLVAAYPDAVFIQTHRSPSEFLPSPGLSAGTPGRPRGAGPSGATSMRWRTSG